MFFFPFDQINAGDEGGGGDDGSDVGEACWLVLFADTRWKEFAFQYSYLCFYVFHDSDSGCLGCAGLYHGLVYPHLYSVGARVNRYCTMGFGLALHIA